MPNYFSIPLVTDRLVRRVTDDRGCPGCSGVVRKGDPAIATQHTFKSKDGEARFWEHPGCWTRRTLLERAEGTGTR